ncbi:hypothetical protein CDL12_06989 [Handroanthus impetiginosus]|uniref:Uncharacterized protein n=1 Tax=Handroanthus impetiginosus TaxID=429701 RepID=A0A2G9HS10_9LAMI|nr:hypothetical protein CDL12_06989 [Handroanthus impetiginosus]
MVYSYTPTYYTSLHDSITSICKTILPFSFKKRRLTAIAAAEQRLSKQQSDNLKWQQESFHQILNLMGLCKEGIISENEVSAFRTHLLETLIASPFDHEPPVILRDKLIFLQELLFAKCITEDEYHASKRPLLQRLAVQGAEIGASDVIVGTHTDTSSEEWSVIDLKEDKSLTSKNKLKDSSAMKKTKGVSSAFASVTPDKNGKLEDKDASDLGNNTIRPRDRDETCSEKRKKKPFRALFHRDQKEGRGDCDNIKNPALQDKEKGKTVKKTWGLEGFKKWKKNVSEDEKAPLSLTKKSDDASYTGMIAEKKKLDEVSGENIKKELSRIQTELNTKSPHVPLSDDRLKEISTRLPADNAELKKFFPKSWCDRNGDAVLNMVRKEFKDHRGEMRNSQGTIREKHNSKRWTTFDDDVENSHPNLFAPEDLSYPMEQARFSSSKNAHTSFNSISSSIDKGFKYNPFFDV